MLKKTLYMSKRLPSLVINDILYCIDHIELYTSKLTFEDFSSNFMVVEACLYNIQIIGEGAAQLSDDVKTNNSQVPWALIKGMRNRLIHEYFGTDLPVVWNVIKNDLPTFKSDLQVIQKELVATGR
jgi:uncharacterized protein with HEPN domain